MHESNASILQHEAGDAQVHAPVGKVLLTVEETGRALACSDRTVKRLIQSGELRSILLTPRARRVPREALNEFIATRMADAS